MSQTALLSRDATYGNDDDSYKTKHAQAFERDSFDHEDPGGDNDYSIKRVETINQELSTARESLQCDFYQKNRQEDKVNLVKQVRIHRE